MSYLNYLNVLNQLWVILKSTQRSKINMKRARNNAFIFYKIVNKLFKLLFCNNIYDHNHNFYLLL
jgi:hypothetical protein